MANLSEHSNKSYMPELDFTRLNDLFSQLPYSDFLYVQAFANDSFCGTMMAQLEDAYEDLPTDDGNVYQLYTGKIPERLGGVADRIAQLIATTSGRKLAI